jgi:hypothetical protein
VKKQKSRPAPRRKPVKAPKPQKVGVSASHPFAGMISGIDLLAADRAMEKKMPPEAVAEYRRLCRIEASSADEAEVALAAKAISDIEKTYPISPQEFWEAFDGITQEQTRPDASGGRPSGNPAAGLAPPVPGCEPGTSAPAADPRAARLRPLQGTGRGRC